MTKLFTKNSPVWVDETLASDPTYNIKDSTDAIINEDVKIELSTEVSVAGTPLTAARMNNIENGIDTLDTKVSGMEINPATSKTTPVDADAIGLWDSVASAFKKLTLANLKATLKTYFDTLYMVLVAPGTAGNVLTSNGSTWTSAAAAGGGGDFLYPLTSAEISITTTATATLSRMHVCSGTSANYTVTLPTAVGVAGSFIGFRMSNALTKLITLDGNSSETIDGSLTRIMWKGESCVLMSDGSNWVKISGKSIPMVADIMSPTTQTLTTSTDTLVNCTTVHYDNTGLIADGTNKKLVIVRPGLYVVSIFGQWTDASTAGAQSRYRKNGSFVFNATGTVNPQSIFHTQDLVVNDYLQLYQYHTKGSNADNYADASQGTSIAIQEINLW